MVIIGLMCNELFNLHVKIVLRKNCPLFSTENELTLVYIYI